MPAAVSRRHRLTMEGRSRDVAVLPRRPVQRLRGWVARLVKIGGYALSNSAVGAALIALVVPGL